MNGLRRNLRGRISAVAVATVGAAVLIAGCGGSSSSAGSHQSAAASLKRAAYVSAAASGYRTSLAMTMTLNGTASGQKNLSLAANGSISPGSRIGQLAMNMQVPTATGTLSVSMRVVLDGGTMYMRLPSSLASRVPGAKPWLSVDLAQIGKVSGIPGYGSLLSSGNNLSNPGQYLDFLRATAVGSVKDLGTETVNGVQTTHYSAEVDIAKLSSVVPAADRQAITQLISTLQSKGVNTRLPIDAWIDASHHVRRLHLTYSLSLNGESVSMDVTENLSDYGPQPAPTVPSPGETTNLLSLINGG